MYGGQGYYDKNIKNQVGLSLYFLPNELIYELLPSFGICCLVWFMVFNATFNNISAISWWSVLLVEETGVPGENHQPVAGH